MDSVISYPIRIPLVVVFITFCLILIIMTYSIIITWFYAKSQSAKVFQSDTSSTNEVRESDKSPINSININKVDNIDLSKKSSKYRIEEEKSKYATSSEYTRRGMLWSKHASWHLPSAPRTSSSIIHNSKAIHGQGLEHILALLQNYHIDPYRGFLPSQDPLQRLPFARYHIWEDLGDDLPKLLGARLGQARDPLRQLPVLKTDKLITEAELRRAHLLLCLFAHAYVWGGTEPLDSIPAGIAVPLYEVSQKLGLPPVLGHPSIVLYNWRRLDTEGDICMENLSTLNNFFDGRDESWFYLITVEVEARGAEAVIPMMLATDAIQRYYEDRDNDLNKVDMSSRSNSMMTQNHHNNMREDTSAILQTHSRTISETRQLLWHEDEDEDTEDANKKNHIMPRSTHTLNNDITSSTYRQSHVNDHNINHEDSIDFQDELYEHSLIGTLSPSRVTKYVTYQLIKIASAIKGMCLSIENMKEGCHPFIFYHRVRPFLSGWKDNPILPHGVTYEGVNNNLKLQYYGGSAAQSALLPFLDIGLGINHTHLKSNEFLLKMREYMVASHRDFLVYFQSIACIRQWLMDMMPDHDIFDQHGAVVTKKIPENSKSHPTTTATPSNNITNTNTNAVYHDSSNTDDNNNNNKDDTNNTTVEDDEELLFSPTQFDNETFTSTQPSDGQHNTINTTTTTATNNISNTTIHQVPIYHNRTTVIDNLLWVELREAYNGCVQNLQRFRSSHINLVAEYILAQQKHGVAANSLEGSAGGKGTGGTELMKFLKPIRDNVKDTIIHRKDQIVQDHITTTTNIHDAIDTKDVQEISVEVIQPLRTTSTTHTQSLNRAISRTLSRAHSVTLPSVSTEGAEKLYASKDDTNNSTQSSYKKDNADSDDIDVFHNKRSMSITKAHI